MTPLHSLNIVDKARCRATAAFRDVGEALRGRLAGLIVGLVAFFVYANSLENAFVWDDDIVIVANSALRENILSLFSGIDAGRENDLTPYYRPLTFLTFFIEERLHGLVPFPMHLLNVLLHAANAFLVYRLAKSLINGTHAALLAGLLFAVHPINAESVDFISGGRNTLLACFFVLSGYLLHRRSVKQQNYRGAVAGSLCLLAALFSKETSLGILPFIVALEFSNLRTEDSKARRRSYGRLLPYALCTLFYFVLRAQALSDAGVRIDILSGLGTRLLNNLYIIPRYFLTILSPPAQSIRYYVPEDLHLLALPLITAWLWMIGIFSWLLRRGRTQATVFGLLWLAMFYLPVSGIIPIPSAPFADRYLYLAAIGVWIIIADQVYRLLSFTEWGRRQGLAAAGLVLLVLGTFTVLRNPDWKNDVALFSRFVRQYPDKAFGHHNLGCAYLDDVGDLDAAEREFNTALALDPYFPRLRTQMGYIRLLKGDYKGALVHYDAAVMINPFDSEALLNRAIALDNLGRNEDAVANYKRFLSSPGNELPLARPQAEARLRALTR